MTAHCHVTATWVDSLASSHPHTWSLTARYLAVSRDAKQNFIAQNTDWSYFNYMQVILVYKHSDIDCAVEFVWDFRRIHEIEIALTWTYRTATVGYMKRRGSNRTRLAMSADIYALNIVPANTSTSVACVPPPGRSDRISESSVLTGLWLGTAAAAAGPCYRRMKGY